MGIGEFFGSIYTSLGLEEIYGSEPNELADYLWGNASVEVTTNQFVEIGFVTLGISIGIFLIYYYVLGQLMQKPSWGNLVTWFIALLVNCGLAFIVGWQYTLADLYAGLMVTIAPTGEIVDLPISEFNCLQFGLANALVAFVFFLIMCLCFKWWSRDYSHIPF